VALYRSKEPRSNTTVSVEREAQSSIFPTAMEILSVVKVHTEPLWTRGLIEAAGRRYNSAGNKKAFLKPQAKYKLRLLKKSTIFRK
jgi:hypothetical protein